MMFEPTIVHKVVKTMKCIDNVAVATYRGASPKDDFPFAGGMEKGRCHNNRLSSVTKDECLFYTSAASSWPGRLVIYIFRSSSKRFFLSPAVPNEDPGSSSSFPPCSPGVDFCLSCNRSFASAAWRHSFLPL